MEANNVFNQLTFSEDSPVKTVLLQQDHFALVRYSAWERGENSTASRGTCGFFSGFAGQGNFHLRGRGRRVCTESIPVHQGGRNPRDTGIGGSGGFCGKRLVWAIMGCGKYSL